MVPDLPLFIRGVMILVAVVYIGLLALAPSVVQGSWVAWVIVGMVLAVVGFAFELRKP